MTVADYQKKIKNIYGQANKENNHNHDYFFGYLTRTISSGFKKIKYNADPSEKFAKSISYLMGICELCGIDLQESFLSRFPNSCPYCLLSSCQCHVTNKKSALRIAQRKYSEELMWRRTEIHNEIASNKICVDFDYFANLIDKIYPNNRLIWKICGGAEFHINKCLEELGEVQESYSLFLSKRKQEIHLLQVKEEICDLLAWVLSTWKIYCPDIVIADYLEEMYKGGCPSCNQDVCVCRSRNNAPDMLWDKEEVENIYELLKKLENQDEEMTRLLAEFEDAFNCNSNSNYKICVSKTFQYLNKITHATADKRVNDINNALELYRTKI